MVPFFPMEGSGGHRTHRKGPANYNNSRLANILPPTHLVPLPPAPASRGSASLGRDQPHQTRLATFHSAGNPSAVPSMSYSSQESTYRRGRHQYARLSDGLDVTPGLWGSRQVAAGLHDGGRTPHSYHSTSRHHANHVEAHRMDAARGGSAFASHGVEHRGMQLSGERNPGTSTRLTMPRHSSHSVSSVGNAAVGGPRDESVSSVPILPGAEALMEGSALGSSTRSSCRQSLGNLTGDGYRSLRTGQPYVSASQRTRGPVLGAQGQPEGLAGGDSGGPPVIIDERYTWDSITGRPHSVRPSMRELVNNHAEVRTGTSFFDGLFGGALAARLHRSLAAGMVRSFFSSMSTPASVAWGDPWRGIRGRRAHSGGEDRRPHVRILRHQHASFVMFPASSSDRPQLDALEQNVERLIEEVERSIYLDDFDVRDGPVMLIVSRGGVVNGHEARPQIFADLDGTHVPLQQVVEARSLRVNLDRHAIKWTYGGAENAAGSNSKTGSERDQCTNNAAVAHKKRTSPTRCNTNESGVKGEDEPAQAHTQNGKECCICLSAFELGEALITLRCLHIFHELCLDRWIKTSHSVKCPLCCTKIAEAVSDSGGE